MRQNGFTLIELLVVIAIVSVMVVIGVYVSKNWMSKSRDNVRIQDINHTRTAFEQYVTTYNSYSTDPTCSDIFSNTKLFPDGKPVDPRSSSLLDLSEYHASCSPTATYKYCLCAELENQNGNSDWYDCSSFDKSGDEGFYCLTNIE